MGGGADQGGMGGEGGTGGNEGGMGEGGGGVGGEGGLTPKKSEYGLLRSVGGST